MTIVFRKTAFRTLGKLGPGHLIESEFEVTRPNRKTCVLLADSDAIGAELLAPPAPVLALNLASPQKKTVYHRVKPPV